MAATVNTLAAVFSQVLIATTDEAREGMRQGCFNYLCSGGFRTTGMMAILGGMNPRPLTLVLHLVAITLTSMGYLLSPFPSPRRFWHSLRTFAVKIYILNTFLLFSHPCFTCSTTVTYCCLVDLLCYLSVGFENVGCTFGG